jgi:hypothetical protein
VDGSCALLFGIVHLCGAPEFEIFVVHVRVELGGEVLGQVGRAHEFEHVGYGLLPDGRKVKHYYAQESVGIATGFLINAVHHAGLVSLTPTPSPMGFLNAILGRPSNERPFLVLVDGYPAADAQVPAISKRSLAELATFL